MYSLADIQIMINREFGWHYSKDKYYKQFNRMLLEQGIKELVHTESDVMYNESVDEFAELQNQIENEKIKLRDYRTQNRANVRLNARYESIKDLAREIAQEIGKEKPLEFKEIVQNESERVGVLAIGDWHYGLEVDEYWNMYSPDICATRVNKLYSQVKNIIEKENLSKLYVINMGDMISGNIHLQLRLSSRIDVVTQTIQVAELLAEFLKSLTDLIQVEYYAVSDNHSRIDPNKANSFKPETFARFIDWYIAARLGENKNFACYADENYFGDDIANFNVFNWNVVAVHGDRDPQKGIIDRLNGYIQEHIDLILSAHLHHFSADENNNTEFFCIGSLIGLDSYAAGLRLNSEPSQLMIIATPENITDVVYKIKV